MLLSQVTAGSIQDEGRAQLNQQGKEPLQRWRDTRGQSAPREPGSDDETLSFPRGPDVCLPPKVRDAVHSAIAEAKAHEKVPVTVCLN